jgi:hypothetical protein
LAAIGIALGGGAFSLAHAGGHGEEEENINHAEVFQCNGCDADR